MSAEKFVLVLGVDASGKSTFLKGLHDRLGFTVLEPTSSPEAKAFKAEHMDEPLDIDLVKKRQRLFNDLNISFDQKIIEKNEYNNVAATSSSLITNVSHAVMRRVVGDEAISISQVIDEWNESTSAKPDQVVLMRAPIDTIRQRILNRQKAGMVGEKLVGFNSLFFLRYYQDALEETAEAISSDYDVVSFDSSTSSSKAILNAYKRLGTTE
jgi:thymidylate kinase